MVGPSLRISHGVSLSASVGNLFRLLIPMFDLSRAEARLSCLYLHMCCILFYYHGSKWAL